MIKLVLNKYAIKSKFYTFYKFDCVVSIDYVKYKTDMILNLMLVNKKMGKNNC